jgi:hypothetical protein
MTVPHRSSAFAGLFLAVAVLTLVAAPRPVMAQSQPSLAEIARKEAERRKTVKDTKKVITTKDMPESARKSAPTAAHTPTSAHSGGAAQPAGGDQKPVGADSAAPGQAAVQNDETAWRGRILQAREALRRNEIFLQALQTRVNALDNDFRNGAGNFTQQAQVNADRQKALEELERVKIDVEQSKKQVADIEEEARKAGVPPGWLR